MNLRKVTEHDDFDAIGDIYVRSWQTAYRGIVPQDYLDGLTSDRWAKWLNDGDSGSHCDAYVVLHDGRYVGTSAIRAARDESMAGWGEIISIYLLPEYFGKGYGAPLFRRAVSALAEQGFSRIYLWVLEENTRARKFYEKQGFCPNGDTAHIEIGGKALAELRYVGGTGSPGECRDAAE